MIYKDIGIQTCIEKCVSPIGDARPPQRRVFGGTFKLLNVGMLGYLDHEREMKERKSHVLT